MVRLCVLLLVSCFFAPLGASAHGDSPSLEKTVGPYLIDIGYDVVGFRPGEEVTFSFDLYTDAETDHPKFAAFDAIDVTIVKGTQTVHEETIENDPTFIPSMTFTFPENGMYQFTARYMESGSALAEATFELPVGESEGAIGRIGNTVTYIIAGALVLLCVGYAVKSYSRAGKHHS